MRALGIIAILLVGIAGVTAARAADLPRERVERSVITHHVQYGRRVAPLVIYDFQPGVVVRAYWLAPWRHRHYFPFGYAKPDPDLAPANDGPPEPAESFERYWSTSQTFLRELPLPLRARDQAPPDDQPFQSAPPPPPAITK
jgi:hypothetical protein